MDRNLILALALTALILFGWDALFVAPQRAALEEQRREAGIERAEANPQAQIGLDAPAIDATLSRIEALKLAPGRVPIDSPALTGSINLRGAAIDDVSFKRYRLEPEDDSPLVTRLSPRGVPDAQYVIPGAVIAGDAGNSAVWSAPEGATLTPQTPVTLTRRVGEAEHRLTFEIRDDYLLRTRHTIVNRGDAPVTVTPFAASYQVGVPRELATGLAFQGPIAVAGGELAEVKYQPLRKKEDKAFSLEGQGGWTGFAAKYWLTAAIPPQDVAFTARTENRGTRDAPLFATSYQTESTVLEPGQQVEVDAHVFVGPKRVRLLRGYEDTYGFTGFDRAIDWGFLFFLTRPIFAGLQFFANLLGNWGLAILALTLVIKAILFPLANASYRSMANMRKLTPEIQALRERHEGDQMKIQQEMMALYKKNKVNPAAGCLPILAQMPIFFALYKVLFTTIELRHQPFLYIDDLSEMDPTSVWNLFGLLPYDVSWLPAFLSLGVLPLLMGVAMFVQTKLNPPPPDPVQARIFGLMPIFFVFIFAPFAAGLVLYWFWNTFLGVIQQYVIMKRAGADVDILGNMKAGFGRKPASDAPAE